MKKIEYEIFNNDAEIISFIGGSGGSVDIIFTNLSEGFLTIGNGTHRFTSGKITLNINSLPDGELSSTVTANGKTIRLPALFKSGGVLYPSEADDEYIRGISIRERRLEARLSALESRTDALEKSVFSTKIF